MIVIGKIWERLLIFSSKQSRNEPSTDYVLAIGGMESTTLAIGLESSYEKGLPERTLGKILSDKLHFYLFGFYDINMAGGTSDFQIASSHVYSGDP